MIIATLPLAGLLIWQILQSMGVVGEANALLREEHPLVVRPPGRLPAALPGRRRLLLADPALRGARARRGQRDRGRLDGRRDRERLRLGAPHLPRLPERHAAGADQHGHAADHVRARAAVGALALQPRRSRSTARASAGRPRRPRSSSGSSAGCSPVSRGSSTRRSRSTSSIHNTLWIVGHFHHMAMLNIGLLIFGAVYALLPGAEREGALQRVDGLGARVDDVRRGDDRSSGSGSCRASTARRGAGRCCRASTTRSPRISLPFVVRARRGAGCSSSGT